VEKVTFKEPPLALGDSLLRKIAFVDFRIDEPVPQYGMTDKK